MIIIELLSLQRAPGKRALLFLLKIWALPIGFIQTSSVALGLYIIKGQCGFEHHKIMPGVGGGDVEKGFLPYYSKIGG